MGLVLEQGRAQLQLATRPRTARRARLRRRARGLPSRGASPRAGVLEARRAAQARLPRLEAVARRARLGDSRVPAAAPDRRVALPGIRVALPPWSGGRRSTATER